MEPLVTNTERTSQDRLADLGAAAKLIATVAKELNMTVDEVYPIVVGAAKKYYNEA